jgi:hypothetical protein
MELGFISAIMASTFHSLRSLQATLTAFALCKNAIAHFVRFRSIFVEPRTYFWRAKISKLLTELPQPFLLTDFVPKDHHQAFLSAPALRASPKQKYPSFLSSLSAMEWRAESQRRMRGA